MWPEALSRNIFTSVLMPSRNFASMSVQTFINEGSTPKPITQGMGGVACCAFFTAARSRFSINWMS